MGGKRRVVTVEDLRRGYQTLLDEISVVENGRFGFGVEEEEGEEEEGEGEGMELGRG